jgi:5-methylcytosine-specific restriction endonuclease McrA
MPKTIRTMCVCGKPVRSKGRTTGGTQLWDRLCATCRENGYRKHKTDQCAFCGFVAIHSVQLDVDHIDGDHKNNDVSNLQTLCANCHRLKTHMNRDHDWYAKRSKR